MQPYGAPLWPRPFWPDRIGLRGGSCPRPHGVGLDSVLAWAAPTLGPPYLWSEPFCVGGNKLQGCLDPRLLPLPECLSAHTKGTLHAPV